MMMKRKRYRVRVYAKRGDQPVYSYPVLERVRPSRLHAVVARTVFELADREMVDDRVVFTHISERGCKLQTGISTFIVRASPL